MLDILLVQDFCSLKTQLNMLDFTACMASNKAERNSTRNPPLKQLKKTILVASEMIQFRSRL